MTLDKISNIGFNLYIIFCNVKFSVIPGKTASNCLRVIETLCYKKSLKIPRRLSEAMNLRTYNSKGKMTNNDLQN